MRDFKRAVQHKFLKAHLQAPDEEQSQVLSRVMDQSEVSGDNAQFAQLVDQNAS